LHKTVIQETRSAVALVFRRESDLDVAVYGKARRPLLDLAN